MQDVTETERKGIPRGLGRQGPVLLSYGFRPFFLGAGLWAIAAVIIWIAVINGWLEIADRYGQPAWHAHELLFGFMPAVLVGYLMTTVPNWTGRFPLSGTPLAWLVFIWLAGRVSMLLIDEAPVLVAVLIDWIFLPLFAFFCLREALAAKRISNTKPILSVTLLAILNGGFHFAAMTGGDGGMWARAALAVYILLVAATAGKLIPSFTNSWLAQTGRSRLASSDPRMDRLVLVTTLFASIMWILSPSAVLTAVLAAMAASFHFLRLQVWFRPAILRSSLIIAMQASYAFIPLGLLGIAAASRDLLGQTAALHLFSIGAVSGMMLAIMNRSIRLHTGRNIQQSWPLRLSVPSVLLAAALRGTANFIPAEYDVLMTCAGLLWIAGFACFLWDNANLLCQVQRQPGRQPSPPPARTNMR